MTGGAAFGIDGAQTAQDVVGTINGKAATGAGRLLTSTTGDSTGLQVVVTASAGEVATAGGTLGLGSVSVSQGWAGAMASFLTSVQGDSGIVGLAQSRLDADIADATTRITDLNSRHGRQGAGPAGAVHGHGDGRGEHEAVELATRLRHRCAVSGDRWPSPDGGPT